jgi:predicted PhzF superfamily epimerase YddE/YHI9
MFIVDAFSSRVFGGNAAGVVPLEAWLPDATMQAIAAENNQAETAFFVPAGEPAGGTRGDGADYRLRWFAPTMEIDLCGHATLASAHVLARHLGRVGDRVSFASRSGLLEVFREGNRWALDFPARPGEPRPVDAALMGALGAAPGEVRVARDTMAVFESEDQVRALRPDTAKVLALDAFGVIATAPGRDCD